MGGGKYRGAAPGTVQHRLYIPFRGDLVQNHGIRRHGFDQHHRGLGFGTAGDHIGVQTDLELRLTAVQRRELCPLIGDTDAIPHFRQPENQIAQKCRFAESGWRIDQRTAQHLVLTDGLYHLLGSRAADLPGDADVDG